MPYITIYYTFLATEGGVRLSHKTPGNVSRVEPHCDDQQSRPEKIVLQEEFSKTNKSGGRIRIVWDTCTRSLMIVRTDQKDAEQVFPRGVAVDAFCPLWTKYLSSPTRG